MPDSKTQEREKVVKEVTERVAERVEERLKEFLTQEALGARPVDRDVGYVRYRRGGYGYGIWPILNLNNVVQQSGYGGGMIQTPWDRGTWPWVEYDRRRRRGEYVAEMARMLRDLVREAVKEEYDELKKENEGSEREEGRGETGEGEGEAAPEPLSVAEYVGRILTTTAAASEVDLGNLIGQRVKIGDTVINIDPSDLDAIYVVNNENRTYSLGKVGNRKIRKIERDGDKIEITFEDGKQIELSEQTIYDQTGPGLRVKVSRGAWAGTYSIKHIRDEENNEVYLVENKGVLPKGELHIKVRGEGWTVEELAEFLESLGIGEGSERDLRYSVTHEKRDWKRLFLGKKRTIMDASYRTDNLALMIAQKYGLLRTRSGRAIGEGDNGIDRWVDEVVRGETSLEDARKALERELKKVYSTEITAPNEITIEYDGGKVVVEIEAGYAADSGEERRRVAGGSRIGGGDDSHGRIPLHEAGRISDDGRGNEDAGVNEHLDPNAIADQIAERLAERLSRIGEGSQEGQLDEVRMRGIVREELKRYLKDSVTREDMERYITEIVDQLRGTGGLSSDTVREVVERVVDVERHREDGVEEPQQTRTLDEVINDMDKVFYITDSGEGINRYVLLIDTKNDKARIVITDNDGNVYREVLLRHDIAFIGNEIKTIRNITGGKRLVNVMTTPKKDILVVAVEKNGGDIHYYMLKAIKDPEGRTTTYKSRYLYSEKTEEVEREAENEKEKNYPIVPVGKDNAMERIRDIVDEQRKIESIDIRGPIVAADHKLCEKKLETYLRSSWRNVDSLRVKYDIEHGEYVATIRYRDKQGKSRYRRLRYRIIENNGEYKFIKIRRKSPKRKY